MKSCLKDYTKLLKMRLIKSNRRNSTKDQSKVPWKDRIELRLKCTPKMKHLCETNLIMKCGIESRNIRRS